MQPPESLTAVVALLLWAPFSVLVFAFMRPHRAVLLLLIGAAILLPERYFFDIKLLPNVDKKTIATAWVLLPSLVVASRRLRTPRWGKLPWVLVIGMMVDACGRAWTNRDPVYFGALAIPPIKVHTALTFIMEQTLVTLTPFWLGATLFRDREGLRDLVRAYCLAGLFYLPFVIIELRLSPQMHVWVYGYLQHSWEQLMRGGGYRPMVFMEHGLAVALFMTTCSLMAVTLARARVSVWRLPALPFGLLLALIVALSHSFGALLFVVTLLPLIWFMSPKKQTQAAVAMVAIVMLYPLLRAFDWFPTTTLVDWANSYSTDRAGSLHFRFQNEDLVLARALMRPLFGWGGFDRIFMFSETDGQELIILDGAWIITYAGEGLLGFLCKFGLLTWPVWVARRRLRFILNRSDRLLVAGLSVVTAMNVADLLPNGMFTYFPHFLAGALLGASRELSSAWAQEPAYVPTHAQPAQYRAAVPR